MVLLALFPCLALFLMPTLWLVMGQPRYLSPRQVATDPDDDEQGEGQFFPRITVVIPARNEEDSLPRLLASFQKSDRQPHQLLVIDDGSTDATAEIARELGAEVLQPEPLPAGWQGKPWACQTGADLATGDWILFLDADTWLEPNAFDAIARLAEEDHPVSSICPYHQIESPIEELSSFFNLIMVAGSSAFGRPTRSQKSSALFGQSLLIAKQTYDQVDGHHRVRGEILENFHLAEHLENLGIPRQCFLGKGVLSMRMFDGGFLELWRSWKKGFTSGAKGAHPRALLLISFWLSAGMTVLVSLLVSLFLAPAHPTFIIVTLVAYSGFALQCWWAFRLVGRFSFLNAIFFPLSLTFYQILFFTALVEKKRGLRTNWKGRDVH